MMSQHERLSLSALLHLIHEMLMNISFVWYNNRKMKCAHNTFALAVTKNRSLYFVCVCVCTINSWHEYFKVHYTEAEIE